MGFGCGLLTLYSMSDGAEPLLEVEQATGVPVSRYFKFLAKMFIDAAGVVIAWQWAGTIHAHLDEIEAGKHMAMKGWKRML